MRPALHRRDGVELAALKVADDVRHGPVITVHRDFPTGCRRQVLTHPAHAVAHLECQQHEAARTDYPRQLSHYSTEFLVGTVDRRIPREHAVERFVRVVQLPKTPDCEAVLRMKVVGVEDHSAGEVNSLRPAASLGQIGQHASRSAASVEDSTWWRHQAREVVDHREVDRLFRFGCREHLRVGVGGRVVRVAGSFLIVRGHESDVVRPLF